MTSKLVVNEIAADTGISTITVGDNMSGVTFKTGTSNLHNVGIEIAGINVLGADTPIGAGATIYNSGDVLVGGAVTATKFYGDGSALTGITDQTVTINNQADNRVITGTGATNTLNAESALTFDGNIFSVTQSNANINIVSHAMGSGKGSQIKLHNDHGEAYVGQAGDTTGNLLIHNTSNTHILFATNNTERLRIANNAVITATQANSAIGLIVKNTAHDSQLQILATAANKNSVIWFGDNDDGNIGWIDYDHNDNSMSFRVNGSERLHIDNNGKILVATTTTSEAHANQDELIIGSTSDNNNHGLTIVTPSSKYGTVAFSDGSSGTSQGLLEYNHSGDYMRIYTAASERFRIDSNGRLSFAGDTDTYIWHPSADQLAITKGGGSFPIVRIGTGGNGGTIGISTDSNLVTGGEIISVRGYSSFKSVNKDYAAIYTHNEGNTSGTYNAHILWNAGGANRGGIGYMPNNGNVIINNQNDLIFATGATNLNGTERFKIESNGVAHFAGDVKVLTGDIQMGNGRGINFSPTSDGPSMGSETLDDYEEGTYTPTISNLGNHTTASDTYGGYTKVGDQVTVRFKYKWTGRSTTNGAYSVTLSLPFTAATVDQPGHGTCGVEGCQPNSSDRTSYHSTVGSNSSTMLFRCSGANVSENSFNGAISTSLSNGYFMGVIVYKSQ